MSHVFHAVSAYELNENSVTAQSKPSKTKSTLFD